MKLSFKSCVVAYEFLPLSIIIFIYYLLIGLVNIDDVWRFKNLTNLGLSDNYLQKIEGLECLVTLQYLGKYILYYCLIKILKDVFSLFILKSIFIN